jgi:predicted MFS family arabinose efflux permease
MTTTALNPINNVWHIKSFRVLLASTWFQSLGNKIYALALPLLVYELTNSSQWMGWMRAVEFLPNLLLALFIGVWVDRFDRKRWSMTMLTMQTILFFTTFAVVFYSGNALWLLFPLAFLINTCNYGFANAKMGIMKQVIPSELQSFAIARMSGVHNLLDALGPAMTGMLLLVTAYYVPLAIVGLLLTLSVITFSSLIWQEPEKNSEITISIRESLLDGWQALRRNPPMLIISALVVIVNTTSGIFDIQALFAAKSILKLNSFEIGIVLSMAGSCALLGSWIAPYVRRTFTLGTTLIGCIFLEGVFILLPAIHLSLWTLALALALTSLIGVIGNICIWTYRQESTPSEYLGRVSGITGSIFKLGLPFGLAISGYLVASFGVQSVFLWCAIIHIIAISVVFFTRVRRLK